MCLDKAFMGYMKDDLRESQNTWLCWWGKSLRAGDTAYGSTQYEKAREELARAAWEETRIWNPKNYTSLQVMKKWWEASKEAPARNAALGKVA